MSLLLHPFVSLGEGPTGYLRRLADANYLSLSDLENLGLSFDIDILRHQKCIPPEGHVAELDIYINSLSRCLRANNISWVYRYSRFCPICISMHPEWKVGWELLFADACPEHQVWLVDVCACGRQLTWQRRDFLRCDCGRSLSSQASKQCPKSVGTLANLLISKVVQQPLETNWKICNQLSINQLQRLIRFLGAYGDSFLGPRPQKISYQDRLAVSWQITSLAAEIIDIWPNSLFQILDRLQHERMDEGCGRLTGRFGYLYTALYKGFPEEEFSELREAFENYVASHWRGALGGRNRRLPGGILQRAAWIPANHACERLGISTARLNALIAENRITGESRTAPSGRIFVVVRREDVENQLKILNQEVDLLTAAKMLGVTKRRMLALLPYLFPDAKKATIENSRWSIPRQKLDKLKEIIANTKMKKLLSQDSVSFAHVLKFWAWTDSALSEAIVGIINAQIVPLGYLKSFNGIGGLIFLEKDLRDWFGKTQSRAANILTIPEVADRLQIKQEVAYTLVRSGILLTVCIVDGKKKSGQGVRIYDLEIFGQNYVFARDLAKSLGRSPKALIEKLAILGLKPVCSPQINGCRQVIYGKSLEYERAINILCVTS